MIDCSMRLYLRSHVVLIGWRLTLRAPALKAHYIVLGVHSHIGLLVFVVEHEIKPSATGVSICNTVLQTIPYPQSSAFRSKL